MPTLSLLTVTTADPERARYWGALADSVRHLARSVDLEWHVMVDGPAPFAPTPAPGLHIHRAASRRGLAHGRNSLLAAASAPVVLFVDDDDVLIPDAIPRALECLADDALGWVAGRGLHLYPDGDTESFKPSPLPEGPCPAGRALDVWQRVVAKDPMAFCPLVLNATLVRRECLRAIGGLPTSMPHGSGITAVLRMSTVHPGWVTHEPLFLYRYHPEQSTQRRDGLRQELALRTTARRLARTGYAVPRRETTV